MKQKSGTNRHKSGKYSNNLKNYLRQAQKSSNTSRCVNQRSVEAVHCVKNNALFLAKKIHATGQLGTMHKDICNPCHLNRGPNEPWIDHNILENRITALTNKKDFGLAVKELRKVARNSTESSVTFFIRCTKIRVI